MLAGTQRREGGFSARSADVTAPTHQSIKTLLKSNDDADDDCGADLVRTGSRPGQGSVEDAARSRHVGQAAPTITVQCIVGERHKGRGFFFSHGFNIRFITKWISEI